MILHMRLDILADCIAWQIIPDRLKRHLEASGALRLHNQLIELLEHSSTQMIGLNLH